MVTGRPGGSMRVAANGRGTIRTRCLGKREGRAQLGWISTKVGKEEESCLLIMARSNESVKSLSMIQPIESVYIGEEYFANSR